MLSFSKVTDKNLLESLNALKYQSDFKSFLEFMDACDERLKGQIVSAADNTAIRQGQGACQMLAYLKGQIDVAGETINRIKSNV